MSIPEILQALPSIDSWLQFAPDGKVTVFAGKVEFGQRIKTALSLIVSDQLEINVGRVSVTSGNTGLTPDEGYTAASCSMEFSGSAIRLVAAEARHILLEDAANKFSCSIEELSISDGEITHTLGHEKVTYWELLGGGKFDRAVTGDAIPRQSSTVRNGSERGSAIDTMGIVTGQLEYIQDIEFPGMAYARVVRPPNYQARLVSVDTDSVINMPGVIKVVCDGSFIAVIADDEYRAIKAASRLQNSSRWHRGHGLQTNDIYEQLLSNDRRSIQSTRGRPEGLESGSIDKKSGVKELNGRYKRPYLMHGSIGPSTAVAWEQKSKITVWSHSQGVYPLRQDLAKVLSTDVADIQVVHVQGAGCYGHNGADDAALDAALLARALPEVPIQVKWSRQDEHKWEPYGSAMVVDLRAKLDDKGLIEEWSHDTYSDSHVKRPGENLEGSQLLGSWHLDKSHRQPDSTPPWDAHTGIGFNATPLYQIPNCRIAEHFVEGLPLRVSALRSLGAYANVFAIESFMDELAHEVGVDPLEFRLNHLSADLRARDVLIAVSKASNWEQHLDGKGRGRGLGFARYENEKSYAAVVVEVEVDDYGNIQCLKSTIAGDAGEIVDADGLRCQLEGGFLQSLSWTLKEEVQYDRDGITSTDWETYPLLTYKEIPEIETILIDRPGMPFLGCGEAMQGPTAAALGNAVFDAVGIRLRQTPFTTERMQSSAWETED